MANVQSSLLEDIRRAIVPDWFPLRRSKEDNLLLFQASVGVFGLTYLAVTDFGTYGAFLDHDSKAIMAIAICWLFAAVAAPVGIFKKKAWGHFLEIPVAMPVIAVVLFGMSTRAFGSSAFVDQCWIVVCMVFMGRWLYRHGIAGLQLANMIKATKKQ